MSVHILIVLLVGIMSKFTQGDWVKEPMGIKMCERECQCLKGCYAIQYDTVFLQCTTLTDPKEQVKDSSSLITKTIPTVKDSSLSCNPEICSEGERSALNRHHQPMCVPSEVLTPKVQQDSRLLVVWQPLDKVVAFEMNLVTGQFRKYPFYWHSVNQILSVPKEKKLFIVTSEATVTVVSHNRSVVWRNLHNVHLVCADERRGILFVETVGYESQIFYRMTTAGQRKRLIKRFMGGMVFAADVDPDQQNVYLMTEQEVFSIGYNGNNEKSLYTASGVYWLRYDSEYKEVYYYDFNTKAIKARSAGGTRLVLKTDVSSKQAQLHDGVMYFAPKDVSEFYSVGVRGEEHVLRTHVLPEHGNDGEMLLCIIAV